MVAFVLTERMKAYLAVTRSKWWQNFRRRAVRAAKSRCQRCGKKKIKGSGMRLEVHHLHYETLGHETFKDVLVLCEDCHIAVDPQRAKRGKVQRIKGNRPPC